MIGSAPLRWQLRALARVLLLATCGLALLVTPAGCGGTKTAALEQVSLQLNWLHEAEFVGYYVADAKGFFAQQGFEVEIREGGPGSPARMEVLNGAADFAISSFAEQKEMTIQGEPVVAVMAVFQIPPLVIFSLADSGIVEPRDLAGKRVGITTEYWGNVLRQTLAAAGVDASTVTEVKVEVGDQEKLYERAVDAWLGYAHDEPIKAQTAGYPVVNIYPADYGVGGYEGLLLAHEATARSEPATVERFVRACNQGWRYALENPDEAAEILTRWAPSYGVEFHRLAVRAVIPLVDTPQVPVGWIADERWRQMMGDDYDESDPGFTMKFSPRTP